MKTTYSIVIASDSENTTGKPDHLIIEVTNETASVTIEGEERELMLHKADLLLMAKAIAKE